MVPVCIVPWVSKKHVVSAHHFVPRRLPVEQSVNLSKALGSFGTPTEAVTLPLATVVSARPCSVERAVNQVSSLFALQER
jgi:hypothetical protein